MAQKKDKQSGAAAKTQAIEQRWTKPLADAGWTALPNIILERQRDLGLEPIDVNVLLQIAQYWWEPGTPAHPSIGRVAKAIGIDRRTVQRRLRRMEDLGLVESHARHYAQGGRRTNAYTFDGLIEKARPFAEEALQVREEKRRKDDARRRRKTPLHSVK